MPKKILLGLTSITAGKWRDKVKEIDELGIKEIALFPTCLNPEERKELYKLLEETKLEKIPHVHLRSDMDISELEYLIDKFQTEVFNVHSEKFSYPCLVNYDKHYKEIYVENMEAEAPTENDLKKYAGLCIDLSHWESGIIFYGQESKENIKMMKLAKKNKIGCNHVSVIKKDQTSSHWLNDLSELDYVKKYKDYLADIISIELENPLKRQMEVKKYLERILKNNL